MSEQFKVGEVVIGQNFVFATERNGMECEIIHDFGKRFHRGITTGERGFGQLYRVRWIDGGESSQRPDQLRKKRPPATDESAARQAMLDCIERAKMPVGVPA